MASPMMLRHGGVLLAAAAVTAIALVWRSGALPQPSEAITYGLFGATFLVMAVGIVSPRLSPTPIDRPAIGSGQVAIGLRLLEPVKAMHGVFLLMTGSFFCAVAGDMPGPRDSSSTTWAMWLFLMTWGSMRMLVKRHWHRMIILSEDVLILRVGWDHQVIGWSRIVSIDEATPDPAHADSRRLRAAHAALTMRVTPRPRKAGSSRHEEQLHLRFPVGGMTVRPDVLLEVLRHLLDHPADRELLADRADAERLFARFA